MARNMREINTTYAVQLSIMTNSFYDMNSKANLFRSKPFYLFNHEPTEAIILAVKTGKLVDLKGNIKAMINGAPAQSIDVEAIKEQLRIEIESELRAEFEAEKAELLEKVAKAQGDLEKAKADAEKSKSKAKTADK